MGTTPVGNRRGFFCPGPARISGVFASARIVAIADVCDDLTSQRVYMPAFEHAKAEGIMREAAGKHFDPALLNVFFELTGEINEIRTGTGKSVTDIAGGQCAAKSRGCRGFLQKSDCAFTLLPYPAKNRRRERAQTVPSCLPARYHGHRLSCSAESAWPSCPRTRGRGRPRSPCAPGT